MEKMSIVQGIPLHFVQPKSLERCYELCSEEKHFGTLSLEKAFGTLATAEVAGDKWTFKRVGFLNTRVTIRHSDNDADLAIFWPKFAGGGWLELSNGNKFQWKSTNFWSSTWAFVDAQNTIVFTMKPGNEKFAFSDLFKTQAVIEIGAPAAGLSELPMLLMLGWYLMVMQQYDATVTVTTIATMG
jgi:hypothetical protein